MSVQILRVLGVRAKDPAVLAHVDDHAVRWTPRQGWTCACDEPDGAPCAHVDTVAELIDPAVLGGGA